MESATWVHTGKDTLNRGDSPNEIERGNGNDTPIHHNAIGTGQFTQPALMLPAKLSTGVAELVKSFEQQGGPSKVLTVFRWNRRVQICEPNALASGFCVTHKCVDARG